ncbi:hypothetical protein ACJX0J_013070, partial [Zea mays]
MIGFIAGGFILGAPHNAILLIFYVKVTGVCIMPTKFIQVILLHPEFMHLYKVILYNLVRLGWHDSKKMNLMYNFVRYDILKEDPRRYFGFLLSILIIAAGALNIGDLFLQSTHEYLSERLRSLMPLFRYYSMTELLQHYGRNRKRICGIHLGGDLLDPIPGGGEAHRRVPNLHSTFRNMTEIYSTITENHHLLVKILFFEVGCEPMNLDQMT